MSLLLRSLRAVSANSAVWRHAASSTAPASACRAYSAKAESHEEFDRRWEKYFTNPELDDWELKRGLNDVFSHDLIPNPNILKAALQAARKLNNFSICVRLVEAVKDKSHDDATYKYVISQIKPTLEELGVNTPEELGLSR